MTTGTDFDAAFTSRNAKETKATYSSIRIFDNGTVWWYKKQCMKEGVSGTIDSDLEVDCGSVGDDSGNADYIKAINTQVEWYVTDGSEFNSTRIVYHTNGTVTKETWTYAADDTLTRTVVSILVASP